MSDQKLTTASGIPYYNNEDTMSAGQRGPLIRTKKTWCIILLVQ